MMNTKKKNNTKTVKVFSCIFAVLLAIILAITIVLTQVDFLYYTVCSVVGGGERYLATKTQDYNYYTADYDSKEEVLTAANNLNEEIVGEGIVLLKNEDNALPIVKGSRISVFGKNSNDLVLGGSGSNSGSSANVDVDVCQSLEDAGFVCNPVLKSFYADDTKSGSGRATTPTMGDILTGFPISETPISKYTNEVKSSYANYNDCALVILSRICGEGYDLPRTMFWDGSSYKNWNGTQTIPGARSKDDHYLQLDQNETDMIKEACDNFSKVVIIVNSGTPIELGFLDDTTHYAYNSNIKACLWLGDPGVSGINSLGKILSGEITPSGKTADTYSRNFKLDPTWQNFGNYLGNEDGYRYYSQSSGKALKMWFVEYREGIYSGYRYYETKDYEEKQNSNDSWYTQNVVYPFGYGLSYTNFGMTATSNIANGSVLSENGVLTFDVEVTNLGTEYDGKQVVELYYSSPYTNGEVEKAQVVLGDFKKTNLLTKNGGKQTVTLSLNVRDMASYDYADKNGNGFKGYELDGGEYTIYIGDDAHCWADSNTIKFTYTVPACGYKYTTDETTGTTINNLFDDVSNGIDDTNYLSRNNNFANFSNLSGATDKTYRTKSSEFVSSLTYTYGDTTSDPWYTETMPTQSANEIDYDSTEIKLYDLIGLDYNDKKWDKLLNQLTVSQMTTLISTGNFRTLAIENIEKPLTTDADGPMGFACFMGDPKVYDTCFYASESVLAQTWNSDLAYRMGLMVGNEGLIGNEAGDGAPYSGWYAPAVNIHRSQFGGRNFEYYSEDGLISGTMASNVIKGAKEKGIYTYVKHFALNEQETKRDDFGVATWANEQSMREIYFVGFEMAVKEGGTTAMMSSFNRIGTTWAGGNYNLLTKLLREEWGFTGMVITDYNLKTYMDADQMIRAGGDLNLSASKAPKNTTSATDVACLRRATKDVLYTVANSCAMNGYGAGNIWKYTTPWWVICLIVMCALIGVVDGVLWFVYIKKKKNNK